MENISSNIYEQEYQEWLSSFESIDSNRYDFLNVKKWNFCLCGTPKSAVLAVKEMLDWCASDIETRGSVYNLPNSQMFIVYFLNHKDYADHGGSIDSSFLTNNGKQLLEFINNALKEEEKDEKI